MTYVHMCICAHGIQMLDPLESRLSLVFTYIRTLCVKPPASAMDPRLLLDQSSAGAHASADGVATDEGASAAGGETSAAEQPACRNPACAALRERYSRCTQELWLVKGERRDMSLRVREEEGYKLAARLETEARNDEIFDLRRELKYAKNRVTWLESALADAQGEMRKCTDELRQELVSQDLEELRRELKDSNKEELHARGLLASCQDDLRSSVLQCDALRVELIEARSRLHGSSEIIDQMHEELHLARKAASSASAAAQSSASAGTSWASAVSDSAAYWLLSATKEVSTDTANEVAASADDEVASPID